MIANRRRTEYNTDMDKAAEPCPQDDLYVIEKDGYHTLQGTVDELRERIFGTKDDGSVSVP